VCEIDNYTLIGCKRIQYSFKEPLAVRTRGHLGIQSTQIKFKS